MLCVTSSEELPVVFEGDAVNAKCREGCARTVGLEVSTRVGTGTALGCGTFTDPENPGVTYKSRTTTTVWRFYLDGELVGTSTLTEVETYDGPTIATGGASCGAYDGSSSWSVDPPDLYDATETEPSEFTYSGGWTAEDVCEAATSAIEWGEWSEWTAILDGESAEWTLDIDKGSPHGGGYAGAFLDLVVASANSGYGQETKLRVKGAFPVSLALVTWNSAGDLMGIAREVLEPGTERLFAAPSAAPCGAQVFIVIGCVAPVHLADA